MKNWRYYRFDIIKFLFFMILFVFTVFAALKANGSGYGAGYRLHIADSTAFEELGEALFSDARFSSPDGRISGLKKDEFSQFRISCKSCHMVDEKLTEKGMRGYTDFSKRTAVPYREGDSGPYQLTHRRTQQMINIAGDNISSSDVYHWDGEFNTGNEHTSLIKLIEKTFISRNMGWRRGEEDKANNLRLKFIIQGDGIAGGEGEDEKLPYIEQYCKALGITKQEFFNLSGEEILSICNEAIAFYIENIKSDVESPFDLFLMENGITNPRIADENVLNELLNRGNYKFINKTIPVLNSKITNSRKVKFGRKELEGLKLFMNKEKTNCVSCHTPPSFTNNKFYNIGVSEFDYKDVHRKFPGEFYTSSQLLSKLSNENTDELKAVFQAYPHKSNAESIDLGHGLFNNVPEYFAAFRTPTLRNLKYSNPFLHSGRAKNITEAVRHHVQASQLRNVLQYISTELVKLSLTNEEIENITAFINSLNDHYE